VLGLSLVEESEQNMRLGDCKLKKALFLISFLVVLQLVFASLVFASDSFSWARTTETIVNWEEIINLPQYDGNPSLLTGIILSLETSMDCIIGAENLAAVSSDVSIDLKINANVMHNGIALLNQDFSKTESFLAIPATDKNLDWGGKSGFTVEHFLQAPTSTITYNVPAEDFADYIGAGNVSFAVSTACDHWLPTSTRGSMASYYEADLPAKVTIQYITTVPEPSSIISMLAGVLGLAGTTIRRRLS